MQDAQSLASQLISQHKKLPVGYLMSGDVYMKQKRYKDAQQSYQSAYNIHQSSSIVRKLSNAHAKLGNDRQAESLLKQWVKNNPQDFDARLELALIYTKHKQNSSAIKEYEYLISQGHNSLAVLNNLAILLETSDIKRALDYAKQAYELRPEVPALKDTYGWILYKNGDIEKAHTLLSDAASKNSNPSIHYHYAVVLHKMGKRVEAKDILGKLLNKDFNEAREAKKLYRSL